MFKMKKSTKAAQVGMLAMGMEPLQIARVVEGDHEGTVVMRTASVSNVEIMNLSNPRADNCWAGGCTLKVELLPMGTEIVLVVS